MTAKRKVHPWTMAEEADLRRLCALLPTVASVAKMLGRTPGSVRKKMSALGISIKDTMDGRWGDAADNGGALNFDAQGNYRCRTFDDSPLWDGTIDPPVSVKPRRGM